MLKYVIHFECIIYSYIIPYGFKYICYKTKWVNDPIPNSLCVTWCLLWLPCVPVKWSLNLTLNLNARRYHKSAHSDGDICRYMCSACLYICSLAWNCLLVQDRCWMSWQNYSAGLKFLVAKFQVLIFSVEIHTYIYIQLTQAHTFPLLGRWYTHSY